MGPLLYVIFVTLYKKSLQICIKFQTCSKPLRYCSDKSHWNCCLFTHAIWGCDLSVTKIALNRHDKNCTIITCVNGPLEVELLVGILGFNAISCDNVIQKQKQKNWFPSRAIDECMERPLARKKGGGGGVPGGENSKWYLHVYMGVPLGILVACKYNCFSSLPNG